MPPAKRKSASPFPVSSPRPDAKPLPVDPVTTGKRAASAIGTRDMLDAMRTHDGDDVTLKCKARVIDWHSAIAQVSGTLVVAHGALGMNRAAAEAVVKQLRLTADDMERKLL